MGFKSEGSDFLENEDINIFYTQEECSTQHDLTHWLLLETAILITAL